TLMVISLLSIVYGALRCNILAIKIRYDDYEVSVRPLAYLCVSPHASVLKVWVLPVVSVNFVLFFLHPHSPFPENIEKTLTRVGTTIVLCLLTFLYAGINVLDDPDLIDKGQAWRRLAVYYSLRFVENTGLTLMWYIHRTETIAVVGLHHSCVLYVALLPVLPPLQATLLIHAVDPSACFVGQTKPQGKDIGDDPPCGSKGDIGQSLCGAV
ncbi:hypothetical protein M9458_023423, partial [Cirrhinus mrigala]